jgi:hypothetical protein
MFLYPFKTIWLKTDVNRAVLSDFILQQTYLSDADYRKKDALTKFFYGLVNENEFVLENIKNTRLPGFVEGDILGVEEETYVKLRMGAFRHIRIYILYVLIVLAGLFFWTRAALGMDVVDSGILIGFSAILFSLIGYCIYFLLLFTRKARAGEDFFRGLLQGEVIDKKRVPSLFLRQ